MNSLFLFLEFFPLFIEYAGYKFYFKSLKIILINEVSKRFPLNQLHFDNGRCILKLVQY